MILPHQIHFYESDDLVKAVVVIFSGELIPTFLNELGQSVAECNVFCPDELSELLIKRLIVEAPEQSVFERKSVLYAICNGFLKKVRLIPKEFPDNAPAYRLIHYIAAHYREDISLKEVAQQLGYEYHYLSRIFHQTTNSGFRDFVNNYRIEYCRNEIRNSDAPLSQIAADAGFQNMRSFDRAFSRLMGMTPQEYRKNPVRENVAERVTGEGIVRDNTSKE